MDSLYTKLIRAGCTVDHHESDLHVIATVAAREIVKEHGVNHTMFHSGGLWWIDVPFMYDPWWNARRV